MTQQLIVEGKDGIAISNLLRERGLRRPKGFEPPVDFKKFIKSAGGYDKTHSVLKEALDNPDLKNIGIVVDANNQGPQARLDAIKNIMTENGYETLADQAALNPAGIILNDPEVLKIGIWVMPDNQSNGYLEHFLTQLIDIADPLWEHVNNSISDLDHRDLRRFTPVKTQKATIHTWLAWQREPGKPFGQALSMGFLDANSSNADDFVRWFTQTFELGDE